MIADGQGRAVAFRLAPGQAHELPHAIPLLGRLPGAPRWVVADRGYASHAFRDHIWNAGARPATPPKRNEAPVACPDWAYVNRNRVERLWGRLKAWRAVPAELGPWWMAAQTFIRWARLGVWDRLLGLAQTRGVEPGMVFLDGTSIRAHAKAAGASKRGELERNVTLVRRLGDLVAAMAPRPSWSRTGPAAP